MGDIFTISTGQTGFFLVNCISTTDITCSCLYISSRWFPNFHLEAWPEEICCSWF